ncbi:MAG: hypothetical protein GC204_14960 [Chloroflexi bacterium]|nr:hypothetical protein [Chloroflexota bacterium]
MAENRKSIEYEWVEKIRARGWGDAFSTALDVLEPLGPLGAQLLWVAQPVAHWIGGWGDSLGELAQALEAPDGIERLRALLEADENDPLTP